MQEPETIWPGPQSNVGKVVNIRQTRQYDVYCGRPGHGQRGEWGNPIRVSGNRDKAIRQHAEWLIEQINEGKWPYTLENMAANAGKTLGCFCAPRACHGDLLALAFAAAKDGDLAAFTATPIDTLLRICKQPPAPSASKDGSSHAADAKTQLTMFDAPTP